jgi:hypothetical protein
LDVIQRADQVLLHHGHAQAALQAHQIDAGGDLVHEFVFAARLLHHLDGDPRVLLLEIGQDRRDLCRAEGIRIAQLTDSDAGRFDGYSPPGTAQHDGQSQPGTPQQRCFHGSYSSSGAFAVGLTIVGV